MVSNAVLMSAILIVLYAYRRLCEFMETKIKLHQPKEYYIE